MVHAIGHARELLQILEREAHWILHETADIERPFAAYAFVPDRDRARNEIRRQLVSRVVRTGLRFVHRGMTEKFSLESRVLPLRVLEQAIRCLRSPRIA